MIAKVIAKSNHKQAMAKFRKISSLVLGYKPF